MATVVLRKRGYHHGDLRRALIRAALRLIEERGPRGFGLRELARSVGVTHTALYRHFPDKAALLAVVAEDGFRALKAAIVRACASVPDPLERFQRAGITYVRFALAHPSHFRVMFGSEGAKARRTPLPRVKDETFGLVVSAVEACQERGLIRAGPATNFALPAWAIVHGLAALMVDRSPRIERLRASADRLAKLVTRTLMEGMDGGRRA
jgi:AcrR family transcriptional regulator